MITMTHGNIRSVIRNKLTKRLSADDIHEICFYTQGERNNSHKEELYACIKDGDEKVSYNALWVFTHFDPYNFQWLAPRQDELISLALQETHEGKKRLLLTLILRLPFREDELRTDFIDYCLSGITACENSCGVRALCIKLSYEQCKFHTDLLSELENILSLLDNEPLSSGLAIARKIFSRRFLTEKLQHKHRKTPKRFTQKPEVFSFKARNVFKKPAGFISPLPKVFPASENSF